LTRKEYNKAVNTYSQRLFGYAFSWTKNDYDANDLVQDVYGKLWVNRKKVSFEKSKSWLFTSMHNALVNFTKKKRTLSLEDAGYLEPRSQSENFEWEDLVQEVLKDLPELQKSILLLRDLEGYNYKEIGDILSISESQVKVYLFRARQKVKNRLKDLAVLVA